MIQRGYTIIITIMLRMHKKTRKIQF